MAIKKLPDDPRFKHVNYYHTDVRKTIERIMKEKAKQQVMQPRIFSLLEEATLFSVNL